MIFIFQSAQTGGRTRKPLRVGDFESEQAPLQHNDLPPFHSRGVSHKVAPSRTMSQKLAPILAPSIRDSVDAGVAL
jgi:hypothetical protein